LNGRDYTKNNGWLPTKIHKESNYIANLLIRSYHNANSKYQLALNKQVEIDSTGKEELSVICRKKKQYIPEKFTYFWQEKLPLRQHFKCKIIIDKKNYSCTKQWILEPKALLFGEIELANRIKEFRSRVLG